MLVNVIRFCDFVRIGAGLQNIGNRSKNYQTLAGTSNVARILSNSSLTS